MIFACIFHANFLMYMIYVLNSFLYAFQSIFRKRTLYSTRTRSMKPPAIYVTKSGKRTVFPDCKCISNQHFQLCLPLPPPLAQYFRPPPPNLSFTSTSSPPLAPLSSPFLLPSLLSSHPSYSLTPTPLLSSPFLHLSPTPTLLPLPPPLPHPYSLLHPSTSSPPLPSPPTTTSPSSLSSPSQPPLPPSPTLEASAQSVVRLPSPIIHAFYEPPTGNPIKPRIISIRFA